MDAAIIWTLLSEGHPNLIQPDVTWSHQGYQYAKRHCK
jgi:hypothetical protein